MSRATHIRAADFAKALAIDPQHGTHLLEPLKSLSASAGIALNILEESNVAENEAEVHTTQADLWHCLEGQATFVCDGKLVESYEVIGQDGTPDPTELKGRIVGGQPFTLNPGDWLWIPAGIPHVHTCPADTTRLVIIKIPQ